MSCAQVVGDSRRGGQAVMKAHVTRHQGSAAGAATLGGGVVTGVTAEEGGGDAVGGARGESDPGMGQLDVGRLGIGEVSRLELLQQSDLIIYTDGKGGVGGGSGRVQESRDEQAACRPARTYSAGAREVDCVRGISLRPVGRTRSRV